MPKNYRAELVGLFGNPVDENPTGIVEEAAFSKLKLNYRYITMRVEKQDLENAVKGMRAMNFRGVNLTTPHKINVIKYLDKLSKAAEIIGAVNVIINKNGVLYGENTDGKGFLMSLRNVGVDIDTKKLVILGAGGAARAIAVESALAGASHIIIVNRNQTRGQELVELINNKTNSVAEYVFWDHPISILADMDIIINATSLGLFPRIDEKPDIDYDSITNRHIVSDVIFNHPNSKFLQEALRRGALTVNGLGMLANQAELNFKLWTGQEPPKDLMEYVLKDEFNLNFNK